jgi:RNAse (barnase) inhibitor barstar
MGKLIDISLSEWYNAGEPSLSKTERYMNLYKEKYSIDFSNVEHYLEMHKTIGEALDFPEYYGCNWDAFWDCLTDLLGRPIHIEIIGLEVIERKFGSAAHKMMEILKEWKHSENDEYAGQIQIEIVSGDTRVSLS